MTRLRVKYIPTGGTLPEVLEEGMLYFVESQHTIWKDGDKPFSGINNVTFETLGTSTRIKFNNDGGTNGNMGTIVVGNAQLDTLVHELEERMNTAEGEINQIKFSRNSVINLDVVAPSNLPYNLTTAISYVSRQEGLDTKNLGILFNDGQSTQLYFFTGDDWSKINNERFWEPVQIGTGEEVQYYNTRAAFPAVGKKNTLYVDKSGNELWYWDESTIAYQQCGFDPKNISLIDTNF